VLKGSFRKGIKITARTNTSDSTTARCIHLLVKKPSR
jgi:hypothetical protein